MFVFGLCLAAFIIFLLIICAPDERRKDTAPKKRKDFIGSVTVHNLSSTRASDMELSYTADDTMLDAIRSVNLGYWNGLSTETIVGYEWRVDPKYAWKSHLVSSDTMVYKLLEDMREKVNVSDGNCFRLFVDKITR